MHTNAAVVVGAKPVPHAETTFPHHSTPKMQFLSPACEGRLLTESDRMRPYWAAHLEWGRASAFTIFHFLDRSFYLSSLSVSLSSLSYSLTVLELCELYYYIALRTDFFMLIVV